MYLARYTRVYQSTQKKLNLEGRNFLVHVSLFKNGPNNLGIFEKNKTFCQIFSQNKLVSNLILQISVRTYEARLGIESHLITANLEKTSKL